MHTLTSLHHWSKTPQRKLSCRPPVWSGQPSGRLKRWSRRPSNIIPCRKGVLRAIPSFLPQRDPRYSSGDIPPSWPAMLALTEPSHCCGNISCGRPWLLTPECSSLPGLSAWLTQDRPPPPFAHTSLPLVSYSSEFCHRSTTI